MYLTTGFLMWLKGLAIMIVPCLLLFPFGLFAIIAALMCSWVAIPIYTAMLWLLHKAKVPYLLSMILMLSGGAALSVLAALRFLEWTGSDFFSGYNDLSFWGPFTCCCIAVLFSRNSIYLCLHPGESIEIFATE